MNNLTILWVTLLSIITSTSLYSQDCNDFNLSGSTTAASCNGASDGSIDLNLPCTPSSGGSGANLALNATVSQSSTSGTAEAALAIDDNTSGVWYVDYSVASTNWGFDSYWTADLGANYNIDEIEIWGRTDCCQDFVTEYYIFVSDSPFTTTSVSATQNAAGVTTFTQSGPAAAPNTVPINISGRYVRIQLSTPGLLQLAEVVIKEVSGGSECDLTINWDNGIGNIEDPQNLSAGTYNVTVSNIDGCTATESFTINEPDPLDATISESGSNGGNTTLQTTVIGGTSPYTYRWNNGATSSSITTSGGNFSVTITDVNDCTTIATYSLTCTPGTSCDDGDSCTSNDVFNENCDCVGTLEDADNDGVCDAQDICPGFDDNIDTDGDGTPDGCDTPDCDDFNLSGSVTDVNCASGNDGSINLVLPCTSGGGGTNLALNRPATQSSDLGTASADLAVDGGTSGEWFVDYSVASTTWATQSWWEVDLGASYNISEIEVWGRTDCCQSFLTNYYILLSDDPFVSTSLNATLNQNGVSDFLEPGPAGAPNITNTNNTSGRYVRIQLQGSGLLQLAEVVVKGSGGSSCDLTINWDNGLGNVEDPQNLSAGIYRVTVSDTEGCSATKAFTISEPNLLNCSASVTQEITSNGGSDGQITATASGGTSPYTYNWNNGGSTATVTNLGAGNYTVTITDDNGCTCTTNINLTEPAGCDLTTTAIETQEISTPGGTDGEAQANPSDGTSPYTYAWSNGDNTQTITNLPAGTYDVTVTDAANCTATASVTLTAPDCDLSCTATIEQEISTPGGADGEAQANPSDGTSPYTYAWSNGDNTQTITNLPAGTYDVTVTDAANCTATASVTLTAPDCDLSCTATIEQEISTPGGTDGEAQANPSDGTSPYTYAWSNGDNTQTITNLPAGTYDVTVTDAANCTATASVTLTAPDCDLNCTATIEQGISTPNGTDGSVAVTMIGGNAPFTYSWDNGDNTQIISGLSAGTYAVTVTDANNCTCTSSINLPNPSINGLNLNCPSNISVFASGGSGATVSWDIPTATTDCTEGGSNSCPESIDNFSYVGELGDSKYFLSGYKTFWADAKSDCEDAGGHLAIIETEEENTYVKNLINQAHFIGLSDEALEGTYKWVDGTSPTFNRFGNYQPNTATKDYVILNNWGNGAWSHASGLVYKFFILEVPCSSDGIEIEQTAGLSSGATFPVGTTNVTYEAEDLCGNTQTCTFSVTVQQPTSSITLSCPNNITVMQTAPDGADVSWNAPTATTTCTTGNGNATITQTAGNSSGSRFGVGTTTISYQAQDDCGAVSSCSFTVTVTADDSATLPSGYCDARGEQPWFEWISRFTLGRIDNGPPTNFKEGRGNFILQSTNLDLGGTYPLTIEPSFSYLPQNEYFRIWIDLNRDADFEDDGEMLFETTDNQSISGAITIPNTAASGATLLRIAISRDGYPEPCDIFTYGEVEDYSVVIGEGVVAPLMTSNQGELLTLETTQKSGQVTLSWLNNTGPVNESFIIERSANGQDYQTIATVDAYESTGKPQFFDLVDEAPLEGSNFYRVKLIYDDGNSKYSDYRHVNVQYTLPFSIYPNPAYGQTLIDLSAANGTPVKIQIYNQFGQLTDQIQTTDSQYIVPLSHYQNGIYWVYLEMNGRRSVGQKMVVLKMY